MSVRLLFTVAMMAALLWLVGCQADGEQASGPTQPWSTKSQSVLPRDPATPRLDVPERIDAGEVASLRAAAIDLLLQAADSTNPLLRANAIEALDEAPEHLEPVVAGALDDDNRGVRFVAAMTVGNHRLRSLADRVEPLLDDESLSVQASAIFALRRCGRKVNPSPLSAMIASSDPEVRGNAALVLGELGDSSALPMLREAIRRSMPLASLARVRVVELQIAEAMVKLGQQSELEVIRAALFTPPEQGELAALACQICGRLRDQAYTASLHDMATRTGRDQEPAEVRLAAAAALGMIDPARAPGSVPMGYVGSDRYDLRAQAALALGYCSGPAALPTLATMMEDQSAVVQVAAAGSILRLMRR